MSNPTRLSGRIRIEPALRPDELKKVAGFVSSKNSWSPNHDVLIEVATEFRDTEDGELHIKRGVALVGYEGETSAYNMESELAELARLLPGHTFTGYIYGKPDYGDVWRATIRDGRAVQEYAKLLWPDGTTCDVENLGDDDE